jgi:uncharacterized protein YoxC
MAIGKSAMIMICFMIAAVAIVSIFSIAQKDSSTDSYYTDANNTINATIGMTKGITTSSTGLLLPMVLLVSILFLGAVLAIFKSGRK